MRKSTLKNWQVLCACLRDAGFLQVFRVVSSDWWQTPVTHYSLYEQRKVFRTSGNWRGVPTSFSSPVWFLKAWPRTPLPYRVWVAYFLLTGWLVGGWLLAGWLAGRRAGWPAGWLAGWLAGWAWLACWYILYGWLVFDVGCGLPVWRAWIWPRFGPRTGPRTICICLLIGYITMKIKCLSRIRGVPTSFYKLNMMFSTNQGTRQDYSSLHQIKAVAHINNI